MLLRIIVGLILLFINNEITGQTPGLQKMELKTIITDTTSILNFIKNDFADAVMTTIESAGEIDPLILYLYNKKVEPGKYSHSLFGLSLIDLYAYVKDSSKFSLYILMQDGLQTITVLKDGLGMPGNVDSNELSTGDFDFLQWKLSGLTFIYFPATIPGIRNTNSKTGIVIVTNLGFNEIVKNGVK